MLLLTISSIQLLTSVQGISVMAPIETNSTCNMCEIYLNKFCCQRPESFWKDNPNRKICCDFPAEEDGGNLDAPCNSDGDCLPGLVCKPKKIGEKGICSIRVPDACIGKVCGDMCTQMSCNPDQCISIEGHCDENGICQEELHSCPPDPDACKGKICGDSCILDKDMPIMGTCNAQGECKEQIYPCPPGPENFCRRCGDKCDLPDGITGICDHEYSCTFSSEEPLCFTYDEQCCKEKGITQKCLGICHDERFEPLQSSGMESRDGISGWNQRLPPTSCDKFEYLKKACLVPIPERGGPNP